MIDPVREQVQSGIRVPSPLRSFSMATAAASLVLAALPFRTATAVAADPARYRIESKLLVLPAGIELPHPLDDQVTGYSQVCSAEDAAEWLAPWAHLERLAPVLTTLSGQSAELGSDGIRVRLVPSLESDGAIRLDAGVDRSCGGFRSNGVLAPGQVMSVFSRGCVERDEPDYLFAFSVSLRPDRAYVYLVDADLRELARALGEASGKNVWLHPGSTGRVTLPVGPESWREALAALAELGLEHREGRSAIEIAPRGMLPVRPR